MTIAFDAVSTGGANNTDTVNCTHECTGSDLTLVAVVIWKDLTGSTPAVSTCQYNGDNATFRERQQVNWGGNNYVTTEIWTLDNPDTGAAYTLEAVLSETTESELGILAVSYTGANNGTGQTGGEAANTANYDCILTADNADSWFAIGANVNLTTGNNWTPGTDTVERYDDYVGSIYQLAFAGDEPATGSSQTLDIVSSSAGFGAMCAVELYAAAGAAAGAPPPRLRPLRFMKKGARI